MSRFDVARRRMVQAQLDGIDPRVRDVLGDVPRHDFVPSILQDRAYDDRPLPIACGQTISQPWIVARMTELLTLQGDEVVLEVGTGSGYQAAVLAALCRRVISVERHGELARDASRRLQPLGNVTVLQADGSLGRSEYAPFDAIVVTAAAPDLPGPLRAQLKPGGRLVAPVGSPDRQTLVRLTAGDTVQDDVVERFESCVFVPLLGRFGWQSAG